MIFNIQRCSIHDGEGLRTLVFLKGCPLKCLWCSNPESQSYKPDIMESAVRCIGCEACRIVCPESAIAEDFRINRTLCTKCFKCVDHCYPESKGLVGQNYSIEELYKEIDKDRMFYSTGGGVTFSGGEPLTHPDYLAEIAKKCRENGIHVVVESCGYGNYSQFEKALPYIDSMLVDIKHIDPDRHKAMTGAGNELILENTRRISEFGIPITIRTPIVPGYTDSLENIRGISAFIARLPTVEGYELLEYHSFGEPKYKSLGLPYELRGAVPPGDQQMKDLIRCSNQILRAHNKQCYRIKDNKKEVIE